MGVLVGCVPAPKRTRARTRYECVLVGCVPVVIQDDVEMAFEQLLPWRRFSLRLNFSDIPILPQLLARVPAAHVARLRRGIGCVWPRMLWLAPHRVESGPLVAPRPCRLGLCGRTCRALGCSVPSGGEVSPCRLGRHEACGADRRCLPRLGLSRCHQADR